MNETDKKQKVPRDFRARTLGEVALVRGIGGTMERASFDACRRAGAWLGLALFGALKHRRGVAIDNIQRAFPSVSRARASQMARRSSQNFAMTFCEFLHLRAASKSEIRAYCDFDGFEHIEHALESGHGCILLTAHLGNWEVMGARATQEFPLAVVARPTSNAGVEAHIQACREAGGLRVVSKYDMARASLGVLRGGGTLGILPDQYSRDDGLLLPLFGHNTRFTPAVAKLAQVSRAPVVPAFGVRREPFFSNGHIVATMSEGFTIPRAGRGDSESERAAQIRRGTLRCIGELENIVRAHPVQWMWLHRRWRDEDLNAGN